MTPPEDLRRRESDPLALAPSDDELRTLLRSRPVFALVGASTKPTRPSHQVMKALLEQGYDVIPVHPRATTVHGRRVYASLLEIPRTVELVDVFRRAEFTPEVARQACAIGAGTLWLQLGIVSEEAARIARAGGLRVVMDRCTIVEHHRLIGVPHPLPDAR